jgi:hypothetical protein
MDVKGQYGHKPLGGEWGAGGQVQATRYVRKMQSRRSLLIWKVFGERLDGWTNDDHPSEVVPGDPQTLRHQGQPLPNTRQNIERADLDYLGSAMPPPEAVAGTYAGPDGKKIKVAPLSDEDRRTLVRWIDLGCPLDLDPRGQGWMFDDNRPTLALTYPRLGANEPLTRLLVGMHDYGTGLNMESFQVTADFAIDGVAAGENLASKFTHKGEGVWEGNLTKIERSFTVSPASR